MKIWNFLKIFGEPRKNKYSHNEYKITHNNETISRLVGVSYKLHHDVYKRMRSIKTPQYETCYILRNKKGFNTILFYQHCDVLVLSKDGVVIDIFKNLKPGFISNHYENGNKILFMAVGTINFNNFKKGDSITLALKWLKDM